MPFSPNPALSPPCMISGQLYSVLAASTLDNPDHGCKGFSQFPEVDCLDIVVRGFDGLFLGHISHSEFFALIEQERAGEGRLHQTRDFRNTEAVLIAIIRVYRKTEREYLWILQNTPFYPLCLIITCAIC